MAMKATRPLFKSASKLFFSFSGSALEEPPGRPNAPKPRSRLQTLSGSSEDHKRHHETLVVTLNPTGMSSNARLDDGEQQPGNVEYICTMYPMHASIATRPCCLDGPAPSEDRRRYLFLLTLALAQRVPEAQRPACPQLTREVDCAQWRCSVVRPVTPCLASQPVLEEHADA